nr:adenylate/guanylate cyclase domain-containing protein [Actinomycetota bacterium]
EEEARRWGEPAFMERLARDLAPSFDDASLRAFAQLLHRGASPGAWASLNRMNKAIDVRGVLPAIRVPTIVLNRDEETEWLREGSRYMARQIPGARHAELSGPDHAPYAGDSTSYLREIEQFLKETWEAGAWEEAEPDRVLATVLFTDIVDSTAKAVELGDARWRELLEQHHALIRRQLARFRGKEIDTAGDGFFASFDGPARAIRCAAAIAESVRELGVELRAGLHTGECEQIEDKVGGIAVHIGARVAAQAEAGEVLVSSTVKDLVAGSGLEFEERGATEFKGIPGEWRLYAVRNQS